MKQFVNIWYSWLFVWAAVPVSAQESNPFDLVPRLPEQPAEEATTPATEQAETTGNPFDIVPGKQKTVRPPEPLPEIKPLVSDGVDRFNFVVTIVQLLLLASLVTLLRGVISRIFQAFIRDNLFSQLYREREGRGAAPFVLLSIVFYLNAGWFVFHLMREFQVSLSMGLFQQLGVAIAGVIILLSLKHLLLYVLGFIFPVGRQVERYRFLITIFAIVLGLVLLPLNLLLAYGPGTATRTTIWMALGIVVLIYLFRSLRALLIANEKVSLFSFHFLLYICTIEIAPVLIFWKLISNQL